MSAAVRWIDRPDEAAGWSGEPLAWMIDPADPRRPIWLSYSMATPTDHADFAARADAGERIDRRRLTRLLLSAATGRHPAGIVISRHALGAPIVDAALHLSVAGRARWIIIAIAADPIGADIEIVDGAPPLWDMLTRDEAAAIAADADSPRAWLCHWVAKEAHAKRLGDPRCADPARIAIDGALARSPQGISAIAFREFGPAVAAIALTPE